VSTRGGGDGAGGGGGARSGGRHASLSRRDSERFVGVFICGRSRESALVAPIGSRQNSLNASSNIG
jgi:hypothetical protein